MRRLILASASPARRFLLESAGLRPEIEVSHVVEDGTDHLPPVDAVAELAARKARAVEARVVAARAGGSPSRLGPLIVGCDSLLELDGESWGKATTAEEVVARWTRMRGRTGRLHTGHVVIDAGDSRMVSSTDTALIRFGEPTDREIQAYAGTAEAFQVAGPFTLEGHSAPWIDSIDGNYGTVTGLSLVVLRRLLAELGVDIVDLWTP